MHRWTSTAPALTFHPDNLALRKPIKAVKMLKMQIDPAMCMKTKGAHDKMTGVLRNVSDILGQSTVFCCFKSERWENTGLSHEVSDNAVLGSGAKAVAYSARGSGR